MPFYIRKSFGSKGLRVNISKSGIGFSTGIKGLRISTGPKGTYINSGSNGFYYRQRIGPPGGISFYPRKRPSPNSVSTNGVGQIPGPAGAGPAQSLLSLGVSGQQPASMTSVLREINEIAATPDYTIIPLAVASPIALFLMAINPLAAVLPFLVGLAGTLIIAAKNAKDRKYELNYNLDPASAKVYCDLLDSFVRLQTCVASWIVTSHAPVWDYKRNAGASSFVSRVRRSVGNHFDSIVRTNVRTVAINGGSFSLMLLPDMVLLRQGKQYWSVTYSQMFAQCGQTSFIENEFVPGDTTIIGYTWQFVNKDGGPDRRFANNRQIPICSYGVLVIGHHPSTIVNIMSSNPNATLGIDAALTKYVRSVKS